MSHLPYHNPLEFSSFYPHLFPHPMNFSIKHIFLPPPPFLSIIPLCTPISPNLFPQHIHISLHYVFIYLSFFFSSTTTGTPTALYHLNSLICKLLPPTFLLRVQHTYGCKPTTHISISLLKILHLFPPLIKTFKHC